MAQRLRQSKSAENRGWFAQSRIAEPTTAADDFEILDVVPQHEKSVRLTELPADVLAKIAEAFESRERRNEMDMSAQNLQSGTEYSAWLANRDKRNEIRSEHKTLWSEAKADLEAEHPQTALTSNLSSEDSETLLRGWLKSSAAKLWIWANQPDETATS